MRAAQVRNIGMIAGNAPVSPSDWEEVKRKGNSAIKKWIDDNMSHCRCVIVLVGTETAKRPWVQHEIIKAWNDKRGLFGIHIHNIKCPNNGTCAKGANPFEAIKLDNGQPMSDYIQCHDPLHFAFLTAYQTISDNMQTWVNSAIQEAQARWRK